MSLKGTINDLQSAIVLITEETQGIITDFKKQRAEGARSLYNGAVQRLLEQTKGTSMEELALRLSKCDPKNAKPLIEKLAALASDFKENKPINIPADIKSEIIADLNEIQKCMDSDCFRSAIILCGRVMETALHRKYFEATGNDLLEKAPGIGLGNLIARLSEKGVNLDPGLTNQIHLINQVRVFSVHTKQDAFIPSKNQTQAIVLYTLDILEKLFK